MAIAPCARPVATACYTAFLLLQLTRCSNGFSAPGFGTHSSLIRTPVVVHKSPLLSPVGPKSSQSRKRDAFQLHHDTFSYGGRNDDLEGKMKAAGEDFKKGALRVHENYWDLFWSIYGRALLGMLAVSAVTGLTYKVSPEACFAAIEYITRSFTRVEKLISNTLSFIKAIPVVFGVIPFTFLMAVPSKLITALPDSPVKGVLLKTIGLPLVHVALWIVKKLAALAARAEATFIKTGGSTVLEEITSTDPFFFASQVLIVAPIIEELVFRRFLLVLLRRFLKRKPRSYLDALGEKRKDLSPWAIISTVIFSSAHIVNWIAPLENQVLTGVKNHMAAMSLATVAAAQFYTTMVVSLRIFSPIFEDDGLAAAIGAHMMWNFSLLTSFIGLPVRGFNRFMDWLRDKGKSDSSWRWLH